MDHASGRLKLNARRESPHHLQVRILEILSAEPGESRFRRKIQAQVCRVFRTTYSDASGVRFQRGDLLLFTIPFVATQDWPGPQSSENPLEALKEIPIGPPFILLSSLEGTDFLEVFLDCELTVPECQVTPIDELADTPTLLLDDELLEDAARADQVIENRRNAIQQVFDENIRLKEQIKRNAQK
jgi:hypothetical protein